MVWLPGAPAQAPTFKHPAKRAPHRAHLSTDGRLSPTVCFNDGLDMLFRYSELTLRSLYRFAVSGTHIVPRTFVTSQDPLVAADIQRREDRCRRNGGIGCCVVLIQCDGINQVMPVEVDPPASIAWDIRDDWEDVLEHFVDSGRPDFKPICTTPMG